MTDLLHYTKKIAEKIQYYDAIIDFTDDSHWFNPFYDNQPEIVVIWTNEPNDFNEYYNE